MSGSVLLFSGGLDSTAIAAWRRPRLLLFIDYGQRPASAERVAAQTLADILQLSLRSETLGIGAFGSGLLKQEGDLLDAAPSPEWWPYRNQLLATAGAAVALQEGCDEVWLGSVTSDGERHKDGTSRFYELLNELVVFQEGAVRVGAPAIELTTEAVLDVSGVDNSLLGWTYSCHRAAQPCGDCPGCRKRYRVMHAREMPGFEL